MFLYIEIHLQKNFIEMYFFLYQFDFYSIYFKIKNVNLNEDTNNVKARTYYIIFINKCFGFCLWETSK